MLQPSGSLTPWVSKSRGEPVKHGFLGPTPEVQWFRAEHTRALVPGDAVEAEGGLWLSLSSTALIASESMVCVRGWRAWLILGSIW